MIDACIKPDRGWPRKDEETSILGPKVQGNPLSLTFLYFRHNGHHGEQDAQDHVETDEELVDTAAFALQRRNSMHFRRIVADV